MPFTRVVANQNKASRRGFPGRPTEKPERPQFGAGSGGRWPSQGYAGKVKIASYADNPWAWRKGCMTEATNFAFGTALIMSRPIAYTKGIGLPEWGKGKNEKEVKARTKYIKDQIDGVSSDDSDFEDDELDQIPGNSMFLHDYRIEERETEAQDQNRTELWEGCIVAGLRGSAYDGVWEKWDDFTDRDIARVYKYVVQQMKRYTMVDSDEQVLKVLSLRFRPGTSVAAHQAKLSIELKRLAVLNTDLKLPEMLWSLLLRSKAYYDQDLRQTVGKIEKDYIKASDLRRAWEAKHGEKVSEDGEKKAPANKLPEDIPPCPQLYPHSEVVHRLENEQSRAGQHKMAHGRHSGLPKPSGTYTKGFAITAANGEGSSDTSDLGRGICFQWQKNGGCHRGDKCSWSHGAAQRPTKETRSCHDCGEVGHIARDCRADQGADRTPPQHQKLKPSDLRRSPRNHAISSSVPGSPGSTPFISRKRARTNMIKLRAKGRLEMSARKARVMRQVVRSLADSGATHHSTTDSSNLTMDICDANFEVETVGGVSTDLLVEKMGTMNLITFSGHEIPHRETVAMVNSNENITSVSRLVMDGYVTVHVPVRDVKGNVVDCLNDNKAEHQATSAGELEAKAEHMATSAGELEAEAKHQAASAAEIESDGRSTWVRSRDDYTERFLYIDPASKIRLPMFVPGFDAQGLEEEDISARVESVCGQRPKYLKVDGGFEYDPDTSDLPPLTYDLDDGGEQVRETTPIQLEVLAQEDASELSAHGIPAMSEAALLNMVAVPERATHLADASLPRNSFDQQDGVSALPSSPTSSSQCFGRGR
jgi:hypothetical protein